MIRYRNFRKWFDEDLTMKPKIAIINVVLVTLVIAIIGLMMYAQLSKKLQESESRFLSQNLESTQIILTDYLEGFLSKSDVIFSNTIMQKALNRDYSDSNIAQVLSVYNDEIYKIIEPVMDQVYQKNFFIKETGRVKSLNLPDAKIYVYNTTMPVDGGLIHDIASVNHESHIQAAVDANGRNVWRGVFSDGEVDYISINRMLKDFDSLKDVGVLTIRIPTSHIEYILTENNDGYNMKVYLVQDGSRLIENRNDKLDFDDSYVRLLSETIGTADNQYIYYNNEKFFVDTLDVNITGWKLLAIYPYDTITETLKPYQLLIIIVMLAGLLFSVLVSVFLSNTVTKRMNLIIKKMNKVTKNRHMEMEPIGGRDEVGEMDRIFNNMIEEINRLVKKEVTHELEVAKLEVELLQSQINPHLLYNTLAVLSYKAKKIGEIEITEVIDKLIRFFKYYLNSGSVISNVESELEMIHHYVTIIKYTYNLEIIFDVDIESSLYKYPMLNLILQPIVENALIHGLKPFKGDKRLYVYGRKLHNRIYFEVGDNGVGMSEEKAKEVQDGEIRASKTGYGISNVSKRIRLYFGDDYGLKIFSKQGEGTKVSLELPIMESVDKMYNK